MELTPEQIAMLEAHTEEAKRFEYQSKRENEFGQLLRVSEQLDMIYHELMDTGTLSSTGPWATAITQLKNKYPKSE
jgi:hypothetical protein